MSFLSQDLLALSLAEAILISFDIETTGSMLGSGRVIEIGAVKFSLDGSVHGEFQQLIDPMIQVRPDYTAIHGITTEMVAGKPGISETVRRFIDFIDSDSILVAHNANFDVSFLSLEMARHAISPPDNSIIDSLVFARKRMPGLRRYKLASLCEHIGMGNGDPIHRALPDSQALVFIMTAIAERSGAGTLGELFEGMSFLNFSNTELRSLSIPGHLDGLEESLKKGCPVVIRYAGGSKGSVPRLITPLFLIEKEDVLYLSAFCHLDGVEKCFRVDRVREARLVNA